MELTRGSGVLMHVTSLPSPHGIGDLGPEAFAFIDRLAAAKQRYWQLLPLNPTDPAYGNSPYLSSSAFALNSLLISPEVFVQEGLLTAADLAEAVPPAPGPIDYPTVTDYKRALFIRAFERWRVTEDRAYDRFCQDQAAWLDDFALFIALKGHFPGLMWSEWPVDLRDRQPAALREMRETLAGAIYFEKFLQFQVQKQWFALKRHCAARGVTIIGDLPIYVDFGSSDVWSHPDRFKLDEKREPYVVSGVPPDYFSATGQLWGNPIYDWDALARDGFAWWLNRMRQNLRLFDIVRIDHFRGLVAYWEVPAEEETAINGRWVHVPTYPFFERLVAEIPHLNVIAEDLGVITPDVKEALQKFRLPGMKVLLFAFSGNPEENPYMPWRYEPNCIVYTGTHDNNTTRGWYLTDATPEEKWHMEQFLGHPVSSESVHWDLIGVAMSSPANVAIVPLQDLLGIDGSGRMNVPGTNQGNWQWRLGEGEIDPAPFARLAEQTLRYNR
ncbi:MAG TPA: 4-alpha-glucanotransferase [bacterium]|nr:4-alpha-glucanotransferase [bacterium]HPR89084.1 4-alpha-glucanotransferase [bacterium]